MSQTKVRASVFETNSSSSHSLVLSPTMSNMVEPPLPEHCVIDGVYNIFPEEYGWEIESHYSIDEKASYLYVDAMIGADDGVDPNDEFYRNDNIKLKLIADAFKEYAGVDVFFHRSDDKYHPYGYIDHQSVGLCGEVFDDGVNGVIRFLFSTNSYFETDNDNH